MNKIGVGIITCNRPDYLRQLLVSLVLCENIIDQLVVVNDGNQSQILIYHKVYG